MDYPKIRKLQIELDEDRSLTLDQILEQVRAAYEYTIENRQCYLYGNQANAPVWSKSGIELGWWDMKLDVPATTEDKYPMTDWQYEVANGDTVLGYKEWVEHKKEVDSDD